MSYKKYTGINGLLSKKERNVIENNIEVDEDMMKANSEYVPCKKGNIPYFLVQIEKINLQNFWNEVK